MERNRRWIHNSFSHKNAQHESVPRLWIFIQFSVIGGTELERAREEKQELNKMECLM